MHRRGIALDCHAFAPRHYIAERVSFPQGGKVVYICHPPTREEIVELWYLLLRQRCKRAERASGAALPARRYGHPSRPQKPASGAENPQSGAIGFKNHRPKGANHRFRKNENAVLPLATPHLLLSVQPSNQQHLSLLRRHFQNLQTRTKTKHPLAPALSLAIVTPCAPPSPRLLQSSHFTQPATHSPPSAHHVLPHLHHRPTLPARDPPA